MVIEQKLARYLTKHAYIRTRQVLAHADRRWYVGCEVLSIAGRSRVLIIENNKDGEPDMRFIWTPTWLLQRLSPPSPFMDPALYHVTEKAGRLREDDGTAERARGYIARWAALNDEVRTVHLLEGQRWAKERPDIGRSRPAPGVGL